MLSDVAKPTGLPPLVINEGRYIRKVFLIPNLVLIPRNDPFVGGLLKPLRAVLNSRIVRGVTAERKGQFKVLKGGGFLTFTGVDKKGVPLCWLFGGRFPMDHAIPHAPEPWVSIPTGEILTVKQTDSLFRSGSSASLAALLTLRPALPAIPQFLKWAGFNSRNEQYLSNAGRKDRNNDTSSHQFFLHLVGFQAGCSPVAFTGNRQAWLEPARGDVPFTPGTQAFTTQSIFQRRAVTNATWNLNEHTAESLWTLCGQTLEAAVQSARHPFHLLTVSTLTPAGTPDARTVVLRHFGEDPAEIAFHTDTRSAKYRQIQARPAVHLHWYSADLRVQLRAAATAELHNGDGRAQAAWTNSRTTSRACYTSPIGPGTPVAEFPVAPTIPLDDDPSGLIHFAVVSCRLSLVEVLTLHASGHQRVRLSLTDTPVTWERLAP